MGVKKEVKKKKGYMGYRPGEQGDPECSYESVRFGSPVGHLNLAFRGQHVHKVEAQKRDINWKRGLEMKIRIKMKIT